MLQSEALKAILTDPKVESNIDLSYVYLLNIDFTNLNLVNTKIK